MMDDYSGPSFPSLEALQAAQLQILNDEIPEGVQKALTPGQTVTFIVYCGETDHQLVGFGEILEKEDGDTPFLTDVLVRIPGEPTDKKSIPMACLTPICAQDYRIAESMGWDVSDFVGSLPGGVTSFLDTILLRWRMDVIGELDEIDAALMQVISGVQNKD
jgi:hypothetical protein